MRLYRVQTQDDLEEVMERLRRSPVVQAVQPHYVYRILPVPDDPYYQGDQVVSSLADANDFQRWYQHLVQPR